MSERITQYTSTLCADGWARSLTADCWLQWVVACLRVSLSDLVTVVEMPCSQTSLGILHNYAALLSAARHSPARM